MEPLCKLCSTSIEIRSKTIEDDIRRLLDFPIHTFEEYQRGLYQTNDCTYVGMREEIVLEDSCTTVHQALDIIKCAINRLSSCDRCIYGLSVSSSIDDRFSIVFNLRVRIEKIIT
jgi:hypothetical protein